MRTLVAITLVLTLLPLSTPAAASHDPQDHYTPIDLGDDRVWYVDDSFPPMIYREDNRIEGFQRGNDGSGHLSHTNPDERIF